MADKDMYGHVTAEQASDVVKEKAEALDAKLAEYNENAKAVTEGLTSAEESKAKRTYKKADSK